jgi:hypothetical protein
MEGGPKGLDINTDQDILVTTNECQTLAFFDLTKILEGASWQRRQAQGLADPAGSGIEESSVKNSQASDWLG